MDAVPENQSTTERFTLPTLSRASSMESSGRLQIIFGRLNLSEAEFQSLEMGSVVELLESAEAPVDVMRGDQLIARAEPIQQDGQLAWRVVEVLESVPQAQEKTHE